MKNKHTQLLKIAKHLATGKAITPIEALNRYGCFRLAARIHDLRRMGIDVTKTKVNRKGKCYASYSVN